MLLFAFLLLFTQIVTTKSNEIDVTSVPFDRFEIASDSLDDLKILMLNEAQVVSTQTQPLTDAHDELNSTSNTMEADVGAGYVDVLTSGSGFRISDEITITIPLAPGILSDNTADEGIQHHVENALNAYSVDTPLENDESNEQLLFKAGVHADSEHHLTKEGLELAHNQLPVQGPDGDIDIVVGETDGGRTDEDEVAVIIFASSRGGLGLIEEERVEEAVTKAAEAWGDIVSSELVEDQMANTTNSYTKLNDNLATTKGTSRADQDTNDVAGERMTKPVFRATTTAHTGFEHPTFMPHTWQRPNDDQLWPIKVSILSTMSCLTLLLIVAAWTGAHRLRRHAVLDDSHFRWAEAVEYMDAFPYDP